MKEASKAMLRRGNIMNDRLFKGSGIDIGAGDDCISKWGYDAYNWDIANGDAQYMKGVPENSMDFVHSSHCLEHLTDAVMAFRRWIDICKLGGYIVVTVPDFELYEHNVFPSMFNPDHKWCFRAFGSRAEGDNMNLICVMDDLLNNHQVISSIEIESVRRIMDKYNPLLDKRIDQTALHNGPECSIEIIVKKVR